jgi:hypothetical protein
MKTFAAQQQKPSKPTEPKCSSYFCYQKSFLHVESGGDEVDHLKESKFQLFAVIENLIDLIQ